jgi:hypothetical protein
MTIQHDQQQLPDPRIQPTLDVETAGRYCGFGRAKAYAEAQRYLATGGVEGMPVVRYGRTLRVPTAALLRQLGFLTTDPAWSPASTGVGT